MRISDWSSDVCSSDLKTVPDYPWGGVISPISSLSTFSPIFRPWRSSIGTLASENRKERAVTAQTFSVSHVSNGRKARTASLRSAMKEKKNAQIRDRFSKPCSDGKRVVEGQKGAKSEKPGGRR